jgi:hypothetical protein
MSLPDPVQTGWDAEARIARVQRIEAQIRLIDQLDKDVRDATLKVTCLKRRRCEAKWELDRLMVNLAILAPPLHTDPPPPANDQGDGHAPSAGGHGRGRKGAK